MDNFRTLKDAALRILIESNSPEVEELQLDEVNGFDANKNVEQAEENLKRIRATFTPTGFLRKRVENEIGKAEAEKAFKEMAKHLSAFEAIWVKTRSAASKAYDADLMKESKETNIEEGEYVVAKLSDVVKLVNPRSKFARVVFNELGSPGISELKKMINHLEKADTSLNNIIQDL